MGSSQDRFLFPALAVLFYGDTYRRARSTGHRGAHRFDEVQHEQPDGLLVEPMMLLQHKCVVQAKWQADKGVLGTIQQEEHNGDGDLAAAKPAALLCQILGQSLRLSP